MKLTKTVLCAVLSALIIAGAALVPTSAVTVKTKDKVLTKYTKVKLSAKKSKKNIYNYKIANNKKNNIKVEFEDKGSSYKLYVYANKVTKDKKLPTLTLYKEKNGQKTDLKKYRFTVKKMKKTKFSDFKVNVKMSKSKTIKNKYTKEYKLSYNKKIIKIDSKYKIKGSKRTYKIKSLKKGTTKVKVYLKGTKVKVGEFKATSGDVKTTVKKKHRPLKLKYNSHGESNYMAGCNIQLESILQDKKYNTTYTATVNNEKIASTYTDKNKTYIYSTGKGTTTATLYQKIGGGDETKVGTFKITVSKTKMNYVLQQNRLYYPDGIFGNGESVEYLKPGEVFDMKAVILEKLINNKMTGSHFKPSDYSISFVSNDTSVASVTSAGKVTAKTVGFAIVNYSIGFTDNSVFKGGCPIEVINN